MTGSGHPANSKVVVTVALVSASRNTNEMRVVTTDGSGAINEVLPVTFAGSVTTRAVNLATGVIEASSGTATVT